MVPPAFDTHRAVKSLTIAGFSDSQAEAVVETVGVAMDETLATKTDLQPIRADLDRVVETMATKTDLEPIRADLDGVIEMMATKTDLQPIRADLDGVIKTMATKTDLEMALQPIRADLDGVMGTMASKTDLAALEQRMTIKLGAMVFASMSFLAVLQKVF